MENLTVAAVYGEALYEAATDTDKLETILEEFGELVRIFKELPEFFEWLRNPTISGEMKKQTVEKIFDNEIEEELMNFLCILIDKRRIGRLDSIHTAFEKIVDDRNGVTSGKIVSALPLTDNQLTQFETETGKLLRKKVKLTSDTDTSLIGGVRIYIDGKLIDASIRSRLDKLKETLL